MLRRSLPERRWVAGMGNVTLTRRSPSGSWLQSVRKLSGPLGRRGLLCGLMHRLLYLLLRCLLLHLRLRSMFLRLLVCLWLEVGLNGLLLCLLRHRCLMHWLLGMLLYRLLL